MQFRPPFEEIKAKYFKEIKKFTSIPKNFKGIGDNAGMFQNIIDNNSSLFQTVYSKADALFARVEAVEEQFKDWVVLGYTDVDKMAEENLLQASDWEMNFKSLKVKGKEAEKLPL